MTLSLFLANLALLNHVMALFLGVRGYRSRKKRQASEASYRLALVYLVVGSIFANVALFLMERDLFSVSFYQVLSLHVAGAVMGEVSAFFSTVVSLVYLWLHNVLKQKRFMELRSWLPSLDITSQVLVLSIGVGFGFLTITLISGFFNLWYLAETGAKSPYSEKMLWALTVWGWYVVILGGRHLFRWPVLLLARMSVGGFALLLVMLLWIKFL